MFLTVKKSLQNKKVAFFFAIDYSHTLKIQGFNTMYGRCTTKKGLDGFLRDGGKILSKINYIEDGKEFCLTYLKINLKTVEERTNEMNSYGTITAKL